MNLEKMNLVGHSFGGYLATSYALKYPKRVENLILADPWGFNEMDPEFAQKLTSRQKNIFWVIQQFNPLAVLRLVGGYGEYILILIFRIIRLINSCFSRTISRETSSSRSCTEVL